MKYTLEIAVDICREIEAKLVPLGYHCALGGSCLYRGNSEKDVDIIIYPHDIKVQKPPLEIINEIEAFTNMYPSQGYYLAKDIRPSTTDKLVFVSSYLYKGEEVRLDLFFLT